jgi:hypothetical protein
MGTRSLSNQHAMEQALEEAAMDGGFGDASFSDPAVARLSAPIVQARASAQRDHLCPRRHVGIHGGGQAAGDPQGRQRPVHPGRNLRTSGSLHQAMPEWRRHSFDADLPRLLGLGNPKAHEFVSS